MSAESPSSMAPAPVAPGLRRLPFTIRLSPQFVNRLLSRTLRADASRANVQGLLFGVSDESLVVVQSFRSFTEDAESVGGEVGRTHQEGEFEELLTTARKDPEISPLELIGWYTARNSGGLLQSDIQFHERYFQHSNHLAMVLRPEGSADVLMELYCRSVNGILSDEGHRWGAVRLAVGATLVGPVEVTMRTKIQDDFFMRAYQATELEEKQDRVPVWKSIIPLTTKKAFKLLHPERNPKAPDISEPSRVIAKNKDRATVSPRVQSPPSEKAAASNPRLTAIEPQAASEPAAAVSRQPALSPSREPERTSAKARALQRITAGAAPSVPAVIPDVPGRRRGPWLSSALVFAVAAGLTFGLVYSRGVAGDSMPGFLKGLFSTPGLGLRLESQGDRVLLSWNRHHPAVRNARSGVLQIDDGALHRDVNLDPSQVSNGSVLYRPKSDDVTFRLEVEGATGEKVSESMRVLEGAKSTGVLDLSAPSPTPQAGQTAGSQNSPNNGQGDANAAGQSFSPPTQRSTAIIRQPSPPVSQEVSRASAPVQNTQPAPPTPKPMDIPVKKADERGNVAYDVLPQTPIQTAKNEPAPPLTENTSAPAPVTRQPETSQSTAPPETNNSPLPAATQKQISIPTPSLPPPPAVAMPTQPKPNTAVPNTAVPTQPRPTTAAYHAPRPLRQVLPNIAQLAPGVMATAGRVEVIVKVNENGHVTEAHVVNGPRKISASLLGASVVAARQWVFEPATLGGKPVPSEHSIVFQFQVPK
jgi:hypothetical protein